jgi:hypothetical protein
MSSSDRDDRLAWFFGILSALFVVMSIPVDGPRGIVLALAGVASAVWALRIQRRGGTR